MRTCAVRLAVRLKLTEKRAFGKVGLHFAQSEDMQDVRVPLIAAALLAACGTSSPDEQPSNIDVACSGSECQDSADVCFVDAVCAGAETPENCPADCGLSATCGNGTCDRFESQALCPTDCSAPSCNADGICDAPTETQQNCAVDCPAPVCGDATCDDGENNESCPADCPAPTCGNGVCDAGEDSQSCPADCPAPACGNGTCDAAEDNQSCPADCPIVDDVPGPNTVSPFAVDRGLEGTDTPGTYKGLPLRLYSTGEPTVTPVRGVIGVVCIGMSNSYRECNHYIDTYFAGGTPDGSISSQVRIANCAVGGSAIERWVSGDDKTWDPCLIGANGQPSHIQRAGFELDQVRVIYHKAANQFTADPNDSNLPLPAYPDPNSDYQNFYENLEAFADKAIQKIPNLQAVYTSSRIYGGFSTRPSRNEPLSYEEGHALNSWLADRIGPTGLRDDVWFGWGPYIWAGACESGESEGGPNANASGVCYEQADMASDGMHPGAGAQQKITRMIHERWLRSPWYQP